MCRPQFASYNGRHNENGNFKWNYDKGACLGDFFAHQQRSQTLGSNAHKNENENNKIDYGLLIKLKNIFWFLKSVPTRWNSTYQILKTFYEKKKILLAIEGERRGFGVKKARMDEIPEHLPNLEPNDFEFLKQICPLLEIFHIETKKVIANLNFIIFY